MAREALALWMEHLAHERRSSPRTLEAYGFAARRYIAFLEQHRAEAISIATLSQVSAADIRSWLAHLRQGDHPLSPRSLSQALSAIRTFHRFLDRRLNAPNCQPRWSVRLVGLDRKFSNDGRSISSISLCVR